VAETRSWLESRHLARGADGARALRLLPTLHPALAEAVLAASDEIASTSVTLAHRFFVGAVHVGARRPERYAWWARLIADVASAESGGRLLVQALLDVDAVALAEAPPESADAWRRSLLRIAVQSNRLAAAYARGVGAALVEDRQPPSQGAARACAWADAILAVASGATWRAEVLANHVAETAKELFPHFDERAIERWSTLVARVGTTGRSPRLVAYPDPRPVADSAGHAAILECVLLAADQAPQTAAELLSHLVRAVSLLPAAASRALLRAASRAATHSDLVGALAHVPAIARDVGADDLAFVWSAAERVPTEAIPAFIRSMSRALEVGGRDGFDAWIDVGGELGTNSLPAALAHFRLETRTSHKLLTQHSAAVAFEEIEGLLQRYTRMLARRNLRVVSGPGLWLRPPITASGEPLVRLPERIDLFATAEENQGFYLLSAAHAAGRYEYGTHAFSLASYLALGFPAEGLELPRPGDGITDFLEAFPNPLLAVGLFTLVDGLRIDARLERDFPGLAHDIERTGRAYGERATMTAAERLPDELVEALFHVSVVRRTPEELPERLARHRSATELVRDRMTSPDASVYDAAALTARLYWTLVLAYARAADADSDYESAIEIGGATVIDPLEHLEGGNAAPPAPASGGPSPDVRGPEDPPAQSIRLELDDAPPDAGAAGIPLSPEELRDLIERGVELSVRSGRGDDAPALGLYITDLLGKLPSEVVADLAKAVAEGDSGAVRAWLTRQRAAKSFSYDEWDYRVGDYRRRWCRLTEEDVDGDGGVFFNHTLERSRDIVDAIKREFRMMRPEQFRKVRGMQHGDDFDLNALVDAQADRKGRKTPPERLYVARRREERDVATLFLLDMSASTDEPLPAGDETGSEPRRVIDVTKETLVLMSAVLDEIGDAYAIYGFSGHGRNNVEVYPAKSFAETLSADVKSRLGGIEPKRSTRMGAALRHAATKIAKVSSRARHLILLSDGFPQDYDYGDDRTSNVYGIRDTTVALQELESQGIQTFCITVDPAGHDYLGEMCAESRYAVIDDVADLPLELPRIYRTVTRL
jgi:hypothetical protein